MKQVFLATMLLLATVAFSRDKEAKVYSETGMVDSFHTLQEARGSGYNLPSGYGSSSVDTFERRVYVVKTDHSMILEVTGWEKHGTAKHRPPLNVGQSLSFRDDGKFLYTVLGDGKEHRYYILSSKKQD